MKSNMFLIFFFSLIIGFTTICNDLIEAVDSNDIKKVERLVKQGVSLNEVDSKSYHPDHTALHYAVNNGGGKFHLMKQPMPSVWWDVVGNLMYIQDSLMYQSLIREANCYKSIVFILLNAGADVNARDSYGKTPLHSAVYWGHKEMIELLLKFGADINAVLINGESILHRAASSYDANYDIIDLLLKQGALKNVKDNMGNTILHCACKTGNYNLLKNLLLKDVDLDINIQNYQGETPGMLAQGKSINLITDINKIESDLINNKDLVQEYEEFILERWINKKDFNKLSMIKDSCSEFHKSSINLYLKLLDGTISCKSIKNILIGNDLVTTQAKGDLFYKIFKYYNYLISVIFAAPTMGLAKSELSPITESENSKKRIYKKFRHDLFNIYLLSLKMPVEVAAKIYLEY